MTAIIEIEKIKTIVKATNIPEKSVLGVFKEFWESPNFSITRGEGIINQVAF